MTYAHPDGAARAAGHPLHPMLAPFPIILFLATLVCDLVYAANGEASWAASARWLLGAGLMAAGLAALAAVADVRGGRAARMSWRQATGIGLALSLEGASYYLRHAGGVETAASSGVAISAAVALLLAFTGWMGRPEPR